MKTINPIKNQEKEYYLKFLKLSRELFGIYYICTNCHNKIYLNEEIAEIHNAIQKYYKNESEINNEEIVDWAKYNINTRIKIICKECGSTTLIQFIDYKNITEIRDIDFINKMEIKDYFETLTGKIKFITESDYFI